MSRAGLPGPEIGKISRVMEKRSRLMIATQKPGMATQKREQKESRLSTQVLARVAETTPAGMASTMVTSMAKAPNSREAGKRSRIILMTRSLRWSERPRSPRTVLLSHLR